MPPPASAALKGARLIGTLAAQHGNVADEDIDDSQLVQAVIPFLRWPGGKRWFVANHADLVPKKYGRYIEPFLGGGSMFFHLRPADASLGDLNVDVVTAFEGVKQLPDKVQTLLEKHHAAHDRDHYYATRDSLPRSLATKAARVIYLNRTSFNGIYRLNRDGRFNVPMGERTNVVLPTDNLVGASRLLSNATITLGDFEPLIDQAEKGDLVFADPPYTVRHNTNGFARYNENLFAWSDQVRLAAALIKAKKRGVRVLMTNAAHESVKDLYVDRGFKMRTVSRFSPIAASSDSRKQFEELVITA